MGVILDGFLANTGDMWCYIMRDFHVDNHVDNIFPKCLTASKKVVKVKGWIVTKIYIVPLPAFVPCWGANTRPPSCLLYE
jgi:hypothetical protein